MRYSIYENSLIIFSLRPPASCLPFLLVLFRKYSCSYTPFYSILFFFLQAHFYKLRIIRFHAFTINLLDVKIYGRIRFSLSILPPAFFPRHNLSFLPLHFHLFTGNIYVYIYIYIWALYWQQLLVDNERLFAREWYVLKM